ncbi:MAG: hypothetical protein M1813_006377 [Trichoglossum hirsutum]|nr:MAG: hypothetical protein M1813_006377 [Trichoglossum hirsutum]
MHPPVSRHDRRALSTSDTINLAFGLTMVVTSILTVILAYVTWKVTRLTWKWMGRPEKPQREGDVEHYDDDPNTGAFEVTVNVRRGPRPGPRNGA